MKLQIEKKLTAYLSSEGLELYVAANDNVAKGDALIELETMEDTILSGNRLLFEIKVTLGMLRKPLQNDMLVRGIYQALHPHNITLPELTVLLMSIHVEQRETAGKKMSAGRKRTVMRYIMEEC